MPSRPTTLAVLLLFALAGCVGGPLGAGGPDATASPEPTDDPGASEAPETPGTDARAPCTEPTGTPVDPIRDSVAPSDYPERPATWNESSVAAYVAAYERAHSRNEALRPRTKRVTVGVADVSVETTDGGYRVRLTSRTNTWYGGPAEGTETATVVHGDGPRLPVLYEVTDGRLVRAEGGYQDTPTADEGRTLECWE